MRYGIRGVFTTFKAVHTKTLKSILMAEVSLLNYSEEQRVAYLSILTGIATADHENSAEEVAFIQQMAAAAQISQESWAKVQAAVKNPTSVGGHLQTIKASDLKFALMADIINLSYADGEMDKEELQQIAKITQVLEISQEQFNTLTQYVQKANQAAEAQEANPGMLGLLGGSEIGGGISNFLGQSGLLGAFQQNGIPTQNFESGSTIGTMLTGLATNLIQSQLSGGQTQQSGGAGGGLGGMIGSLLGGGATGGQQQQGGGIGGMVTSFLGSPQGQQAISGLVSQVMGGQKQGQGLGNLTSLLGGGVQQRRQQSTQQGGGAIGSLIGSLLGG
ncbi:MAG: TerB family tellurite resistance protein [Bacteroidota bacterium]